MGHQKHIKVTKAQISNDAETLVQSLERVTQQLKYSSQTHYSSGDGVWHSIKRNQVGLGEKFLPSYEALILYSVS